MRKLLLLLTTILLQTGFVKGQAIVKSYGDEVFYQEIDSLPLYNQLPDRTISFMSVNTPVQVDTIQTNEYSVEAFGIDDYEYELENLLIDYNIDTTEKLISSIQVVEPNYAVQDLYDNEYAIINHKDSIIKYYVIEKTFELPIPKDTIVRAYAVMYNRLDRSCDFLLLTHSKQKNELLSELNEELNNFIGFTEYYTMATIGEYNTRKQNPLGVDYFCYGPLRRKLYLKYEDIDSLFTNLINKPELANMPEVKSMICYVFAAYLISHSMYDEYKDFVIKYRREFFSNPKTAIHWLVYDRESAIYLKKVPPFPHSGELTNYLKKKNILYTKD